MPVSRTLLCRIIESKTSQRWWRALALGVALCVVPQVARALVLPSYGLRNGPTIPANGAFLFDEAVVAVTVTRDSTVVPGTLVEREGYLIWRPEQQLTPGEYLVQPTLAPNTFGSPSTGTVTVVEALSLPADFVSVSIETDVRIAGEPTARSCCGTDEELARLEPPCRTDVVGSCRTQQPQPYCAPTRYQQAQTVIAATSMDTAHPLSSQVLVQLALLDGALEGEERQSTAYFSMQAWLRFDDFEAVADEYCATLAVWNLIDDSVESKTECVPNAMPTLIEIDVEPGYFSTIERCLLPPEGLTEQWCGAMHWDCEVKPVQQSTERYDYNVALCTHYYDLCDATPPPASDTAAGGGPATEEGTGATKATAARNPGGDPLRCTVSTVPPQHTGWPATALLFLALAAATPARRRGRQHP